MSDLTKVSAELIDDVTFYVSDDRAVTGMSVQGFIKFSGVPETSVRRFIDETGIKTMPVLASSVRGSVTHANLVSSQDCSSLLYHFALDVKKIHHQARFVVKKFLDKSFHEWILETTGKLELKPKSELRSMIELAKMAVRIFDETEANQPGLHAQLMAMGLVEDDGTLISARQFAEEQLGRELTKSEVHDLANQAALTYQNHYGEKPQLIKVSGVAKSGNRFYNQVYGYSPKDYKLVEVSMMVLNIH